MAVAMASSAANGARAERELASARPTFRFERIVIWR